MHSHQLICGNGHSFGEISRLGRGRGRGAVGGFRYVLDAYPRYKDDDWVAASRRSMRGL